MQINTSIISRRAVATIMLSLSILLTTGTPSPAQAPSFLLLSHDARALSMGGAGVAASDAPGTILGNPAALGSVVDPTAIVSASRPPYDEVYASASVAFPLGEGAGTLAGYISYGVGTEFQTTYENGQLGPVLREGPYVAAGLGWGIELLPGAKIGVRGRLIHTSYPFSNGADVMNEASTSFAIDIGTQVQLDPVAHIIGLPDNSCNIGVAVMSIGPSFTAFSYEESLPTAATAGLSIRPYTDSTFRISAMVDARIMLVEGYSNTPVTVGVGAEVELFRTVALRLGATTFEWRPFKTDINPTVGLGVRIDSFDLSAAYTGNQIYSAQKRFDLSVGFHW